MTRVRTGANYCFCPPNSKTIEFTLVAIAELRGYRRYHFKTPSGRRYELTSHEFNNYCTYNAERV